MRDKEKMTVYMQKYRFTKTLEQWKKEQKKCTYCDKVLETIHHKDEDHANNRLSNYEPVCQEHHLEIPHSCDTPGYYAQNKPLKPSVAVYRSKNAADYLLNTVNQRISNITIRNPTTCRRLHLIEVGRHCFEFLTNLGYSEICS